jgi:VIT1/CCC1 family predicted Fe2+/Mn2+ transporter
MSEEPNSRRFLAYRNDELNSALLYDVFADHEKNPKIAGVYRRLAETERKHAALWEDRLRAAGTRVPEFRQSWRTRTLAWLAGRFGVDAILPTVASAEDIDAHGYKDDASTSRMATEERSHARLLRHIGRTTKGGLEGGAVAQLEGRHRSAGGNAVRAAVLGASDGLLSNFNLVMGVVGGEMSSRGVILTGFAGLLAGSISMALGEWISVQSSRELYQRQIETERGEIANAPEEEIEELVLIYQSRGIEEEVARTMASKIMSNEETALSTLVRDELGIDPEELGGSAWEAAVTSFLLFAVGAIIPVIPFLFLQNTVAILTSALFSAAGLFLLGAAITLFTGKPAVSSGLRQVLFGLIAAGVAFGIGRLIGVSIAG